MPYPERFPEFTKGKFYRAGKLTLGEAEMLVFRVKQSIEEYLSKIPTFEQLLTRTGNSQEY